MSNCDHSRHNSGVIDLVDDARVASTGRNVVDGEIGAGLFGLTILVAAGMWAIRERSSAMLRASNNSDPRTEEGRPSEPEVPDSGEYPSSGDR